MRINWREDIITGGLCFLFFLIPGLYLCLYRNYLPYDSLARLVNAWLVLHGTEAKLASIGFVWPPLPILALIPLTIFPTLVKTWAAVVIVSAFFMSVACVAVGHIASLCGVSSHWRRLIVFLFTTNPLILMFGANGMSEAFLVAVSLLASYFLIRFWQRDRNNDLIMASGFFGLLPLLRYEYALLSAGSGILIVLLSWRRRSIYTEENFRQFLEGRLLAYSALAVYPSFLWAVANWFVMGNPFYFLFNDRSAVSLADLQISDYSTLVTSPFYSFQLVFGVWFLIFFLGTVASTLALFLGVRQKSTFLLGFGLLPVVIPFMQFILLSQRANVPLLRYYMMAIPLGTVTALAVVFHLQSMLKRYRRGVQFFMSGFILLFILSNFLSAVYIYTYPYQNIERDTWKALTTKETIENRRFLDAYKIGKMIPSIIPQGSRVLIDTYLFGFGIMLGAGDHRYFMDFTDPDYDAAVLNPPAYVDYVIVPSITVQRGNLYSINRVHKKLHEEGATWAELVDVLPDTSLGWKLYKVNRK